MIIIRTTIKNKNDKNPLPSQVSTHGYSQNQILIWKYPSLHKIAKLTGHTLRVLYLVGGGGEFWVNKVG